jgi:hypothetical protein
VMGTAVGQEVGPRGWSPTRTPRRQRFDKPSRRRRRGECVAHDGS